MNFTWNFKAKFAEEFERLPQNADLYELQVKVQFERPFAMMPINNKLHISL